jgi:hypothetical protein
VYATAVDGSDAAMNRTEIILHPGENVVEFDAVQCTVEMEPGRYVAKLTLNYERPRFPKPSDQSEATTLVAYMNLQAAERFLLQIPVIASALASMQSGEASARREGQINVPEAGTLRQRRDP